MRIASFIPVLATCLVTNFATAQLHCTVVAAGVTGIAIAATRGPDDGSLPPGSVTLTP